MHSSMCVRLAACVVLVASASCHVIKSQQVPLSPAGLTPDVMATDKGDHIPPHKIDVDETTKTVTVSNVGAVPGNSSKSEFVPSLENRHGIVVGYCPEGYTRRGGFCFPDDDY